MEKKYDIKLLDDRVRVPVMASAGAAAYDLQAARIINEDKTITPLTASMKIEPGETVKVGTGVAVHIKDREVAGFIIPRSGKGTQGLVVGNLVGLIDSDYQGELIVSLWNRNPESSGKTLWVEPLERVRPDILYVDNRRQFYGGRDFSEETDRGAGGFGSTGGETGL